MSAERERVEALVVARAYATRKPATLDELIRPLMRFCPQDMTPASWRAELEETVGVLRERVLGDGHLLVDRDELARRIGRHHASGAWPQLADRVLPALGLGVAADDGKALGKLATRDAWAAAIVARAVGQWQTGTPPTLAQVCDAFAWERLGLTTKPKRLPAEVRSLFLQQELGVNAAPPDRLVRQLAARELGVPRADARALREGLVRSWLAGRTLGGTRAGASVAAAEEAIEEASFVASVEAVARRAGEAEAFGARKVFISEVWQALRREPPFARLSLDEFKGRLIAAHRAGELVLARADLVAAMNPELVASSETVSDGASFHFVVRNVP